MGTGEYLAYCEGYILGQTEALHNAGSICLPIGATGIQAEAVVRKYLKDHPELWDRAAWWLTKQALTSAFPCR
ncbi:Rap1a/Tai family immunity protein [Sphingomonas daechungensis]|uniref:Rap1a/Tai family immunity protein n=1 Tax=Sphingomonas daechungensis TaxID=1176646 RepID=UPI0037839883